ncbi:MAG: DUF4347 domain-containing protein, partial [Cyanobacteriota bacterium]|nr:DUF4347 domain-containing protein [Cyanobacteriota bacterium]
MSGSDLDVTLAGPFPEARALPGSTPLDPLAWAFPSPPAPLPPAVAVPTVGDELYVVTISDGDLEALADQLDQDGADVWRLAPGATIDSLLHNLEHTRAGRDLQRLHLISHATAGELRIGDTLITPQTLARQRDALRHLGRSLAPGADLLLYGCDLAAGEPGQRLIEGLARLTGADVAASTDRTFAGGPGAPHNWELEASVGTITPGGQDRLTGLGWSGALGGSASFENGVLRISDASGSFAIAGSLTSTNTGPVTLSGSVAQQLTLLEPLQTIAVSGRDYTITGLDLDGDPGDGRTPSAYGVDLTAEGRLFPGEAGQTISTGITLTGVIATYGGDLSLRETNTTVDLPLVTWNPQRRSALNLGQADRPLQLSTLAPDGLSGGRLLLDQEVAVDPFQERMERQAAEWIGSASINEYLVDNVLTTGLYGLQSLVLPASVKVADIRGGIRFDQATVAVGSLAVEADVSLNLAGEPFVRDAFSAPSLLTNQKLAVAAAVMLGTADSGVSLHSSTIRTTSGDVSINVGAFNKLSAEAQVWSNLTPAGTT